MARDLLPPRLLSLSDCICDFVPDLWAIEWASISAAERAAKAGSYGIAQALLPEVIKWTTNRVNSDEFGWPCVFLSIQDAQAFAARFLTGSRDLSLLGIGLHEDIVDEFLEAEIPSTSEGTPGVYRVVSDGVELVPGGRELGWEILYYDHGGFHSWLCNGLEKDVASMVGIRPAETGFISSAREALEVARYCGQDNVGAEPGFWAPWLVVEYRVSSAEA